MASIGVTRPFLYLQAKAEVASFPKGHALFTVGEEPDGIYLLLSGSVEVRSMEIIQRTNFTVHTSAYSRYLLQAVSLPNLVVSHQEYNEEMTFTAGDVLGERAILTGKRLHTSYICKSPIQVSICLYEHFLVAVFRDLSVTVPVYTAGDHE